MIIKEEEKSNILNEVLCKKIYLLYMILTLDLNKNPDNNEDKLYDFYLKNLDEKCNDFIFKRVLSVFENCCKNKFSHHNIISKIKQKIKKENKNKRAYINECILKHVSEPMYDKIDTISMIYSYFVMFIINNKIDFTNFIKSYEISYQFLYPSMYCDKTGAQYLLINQNESKILFSNKYIYISKTNIHNKDRIILHINFEYQAWLLLTCESNNVIHSDEKDISYTNSDIFIVDEVKRDYHIYCISVYLKQYKNQSWYQKIDFLNVINNYDHYFLTLFLCQHFLITNKTKMIISMKNYEDLIKDIFEAVYNFLKVSDMFADHINQVDVIYIYKKLV